MRSMDAAITHGMDLMLGAIAAAFILVAGNYPSGAMHDWFDSLRSKKGLCCSFADGRTLADPDWGTDEHGYWVVVDGVRVTVPSDALVETNNKFGPAVVWPYKDASGKLQIRCFLPGALT